jgi:periplasmic divalent cation tolerance protein
MVDKSDKKGRLKMTEFVQIVVTIDTKEAALQIANTLVESKTAACAQVSGPITSVYEWKEKIEKTEEWYIVIKTRQDRYRQVEERIKALHPYEVPEIISLPIVDGSSDYLKWITNVVKG